MKTKSVISISSLALLLGLAVFTSPVHAADSKLSSKDKSFVTNASEAGNAEIQASELANKKSSSKDVKELAEMMIKDHSKAAAALEKIATAKGDTPDKGPGAMQKANILLLETKSGDSFDKAFAETMVKDHKAAVELFEKASTDLDDAELKEFAKTTLPTLKHHLEMAEELAKKLGS